MNLVNNLSLKAKITGMSAVLVVIFLLFALFSFSTLNKLKVNGPIYKSIVQGKDLIADILPPPEYIIESYLVVLSIAGEHDSQKIDQLISRLDKLKNEYADRHEYWLKEMEDGELKTTLVDRSYRPAMEFYDIVDKQFIPAVRQKNENTIRELAYGTLLQKYEEHRGVIDKVVEMATVRYQQDELRAASEDNSKTWIQKAVMIFGALFMLGLALYVSFGLSRAINQIVTGLREGAEQVSSASEQIASASQSLAEGVSNQASSIEESSSALEQMSSMTHQNADNASQANIIANDASAAADKGANAMNGMTNAIGEIKKSSDETAKIIKVIDEIAFQTNLLALNAAVEAARAGEAGKGFAVVAEEVRNLAQRSAEAAKNTSSLIESAQKNADNGVRSIEEFKAILTEITTNIKKVSALIGDVTTASGEQSQGIGQISASVSQMDQITQQNASTAEESSSASEELAAQAQQMQMIVGELFKLVNGANTIMENDSHRNSEGKAKSSINPKSANSYGSKDRAHYLTAKARDHKGNNNALFAGQKTTRKAQDIIPLEKEEMANF